MHWIRENWKWLAMAALALLAPEIREAAASLMPKSAQKEQAPKQANSQPREYTYEEMVRMGAKPVR